MPASSRYDRFTTHRTSRRLAGHDYAAARWYFVTICARNREHLFGEIRDGIVGLEDAGCVAHACWRAIPDHAPGVRVGAFVAMPNHVHGLIGLPPAPPMTSTDPVAPLHATASPTPTSRTTPTSRARYEAMSELSPTAGSLSVVVRSYKAAVTRIARRVDPAFAWQARFHDHVVRDAVDLERIWAYVEANPETWSRDRHHVPDRPRGRGVSERPGGSGPARHGGRP